MQLYTDELSASWPDGSENHSEVVICKDHVSGEEHLARVFSDSSEKTVATILQQFSLHRSLSSSGVADAGDLIDRNGRLVGYSMPRLPGQSLVDARPTLDDRSLVSVILDVSFAAFCIHSIGYIHSDLAPNNIWINRSDARLSATLLDLGFATPIGSRTPTESRGTENFIAPECRRGEPAHPSSDVYSFGKVVGWLIPQATDAALVTWMQNLVKDCTVQNVVGRLSDFSDIYFRVLRFARAHFDISFPHTFNLVPLRTNSLPARKRSLRALLDSNQSKRIIACFGDRRCGKSELLRSLSTALQHEGRKTIRYSGISNFDELMYSLEQLVGQNYPLNGVVAIVETEVTFELGQSAVDRLAGLAEDQHIRIVFEARSGLDSHGSRHIREFTVRPLTVRESIRASSHLVKATGIIGAHGDALWSVTAGLPGMIKEAMTDYLKSARRSRGEPLEFVRWHGYSSSIHGSIAPGVGPSATALATLREKRNLLGTSIADIRRTKRVGSIAQLSTYNLIARMYADLGSPRRQTRWARRGVDSFKLPELLHSGVKSLEEYLGLMTVCMPPAQRIEILSGLSFGTSATSRLAEVIIKSELGAAYLYAKRPSEAGRVLLEAMALAKRDRGCTDQLTKILNRLGTAKMLTGDYTPARKYLAESSKLVQSTGDHSVAARIKGNLGLISLYCGEPEVGLENFKSLKWTSARSRNYAEYLSHVLNETVCLLDLGRGLAAERRARHAVTLGEMLSDDLLLAHAYNNLGWILMTRCQAAAASSMFRQSLTLRERIGDVRGAGDNVSNFARLFLLARDYVSAEESIADAERRYLSAGHREGVWDCARLRARAALLQEDYESVSRNLDAIPVASDELPAKDRADILLLQTERALWLNETDTARALMQELDAMPLAARIAPLAGRRRLMRGHAAMNMGDIDLAIVECNGAAEQFRKADREDLLLDALTILSALAYKTRNAAAGLRSVAYIESVTAAMKEELR